MEIELSVAVHHSAKPKKTPPLLSSLTQCNSECRKGNSEIWIYWLIWHGKGNNLMYKKINIVPGIQKIWQPWHAFFGNPEKQNTDLKVFNHNYEETDVPFLIRVPIQFKIGQIIINMATLKIQIWVLIRNCPKTDISSTIFIICPAGTNMIVYMRRWFSPMTFWWESPSHINNHLCSWKSYHENYWWNINFRAISN